MSDGYLVRPLRWEQIAQAYPLVSIFEPGLSREMWDCYASALVGHEDLTEDPNIAAVQNERGHIYGLSAYRVKPDLHRGPVLDVESFVVADLVGVRRIAKRLLVTLESLAQSRSCSCLTISTINPLLRRCLQDRRSPGRDMFKISGYRLEPFRLRKCFGEQTAGFESPSQPEPATRQ